MKILLLGATGKLGQEVAKVLKESIYSIRIMARSPEKVFLPKDGSFEVVKGDALSLDDVKKAMVDIDVVVSCVGPRSIDDSKNKICMNSTKNIIEAGAKRYIVVSGAIVSMEGDEQQKLGTRLFKSWFKVIKKPIFEDRTEERDILLESDIDWTIVRMPHLNEESEGRLEASDRKLPSMKVYTTPLASWIVSCLIGENKFIKKGVFVGSFPLTK